MSDTTIQEKRAIFEKVINNPNLPDSVKKIAREGLAKLSEGTPKTEASNQSSDSEKRAIFEKVINNPNLPDSAKKIAREGLAKLSGGESKTEAKKEKVVKQPKAKKEKVVKQPKAKKEKVVKQPKAEKDVEDEKPFDNDEYCRELIAQETEKKAKRKEAAEKRKDAPKKKEATKIKEGIERLEDKVEEKVSKGKITKAEIIKLIDNTKALLKSLEKQLKEFGTKKMAEGGNVGDEDEVNDVAKAIFNSNNKNGKISTSLGSKSLQGLVEMIKNTHYDSEFIASSIFSYNNKKGLISTSFGDKKYGGLLAMIEYARTNKSRYFNLNKFAKGGNVEGGYKIFVGHDHRKNNELYQVVGINNDYVGEWHKDIKDAKDELKDLDGISDSVSKFAEGGNVGNGDKFTYMMLSRLQMDNDYYLNMGSRSARNLWAGSVDEQIKEMKRLWNSLPEDRKPEWLSMEDIKEYEKEMTSDKFAKGGSIKRTKNAIDADKNLRAMPKGERVSHPFAIIRKANGETFKRRNANQFGRVEGDEVYREYRVEHTDKDQKKRFAEGGNVEKNINKKVLSFLSQEMKDEVLSNVAKHYKISKKEALEEVTDNEAERLYEYIANNPNLRMDIYDAYNYINANKFAKGGNVGDEDINKKLRSVKVSYSNGEIIATSMAAHLTDEEILNYFKIGKVFNIGNVKDNLQKVTKVEILDKTPKFAKGGSIKRTKRAIEADKNLRAMPKGERVSHPFAIIRKANGETFKRRNANQFGRVEGDEVYREYRVEHTDKDQKKRF